VVIPVLVLAIAAVISQLVYNSGGTIEVAETANALFVVGFAFIAASILASIGFAAARKGEIARGAGFGACIAVMIGIIELGLLEWLGGV
jgi:hypothetical protein